MERTSTDSTSQPPAEPPQEPIPASPYFPMTAAASQRNAGAAVVTALAYIALFFITPRLPFSQATVVTATLFLLALSLLFVVLTARALRTPRSLAVNTLISGALALPSILLPILFARFPTWTGWKEVLQSYSGVARTIAYVPGLRGLLVIWLAACVGVWISRLLREMKILLPIAVVLACMDLYVVFGGGLVTQANTGKAPVAQAAMSALSVHLPKVPGSRGAAPMDLSVGFADFLFIALFFACFARFGIPSRNTFLVLCGVLVSYLAVVYWFGIALPALVPIAVVVVGMNLRAFRYERSEAFALLYAGLIVAVVLGGLFYFSHHR